MKAKRRVRKCALASVEPFVIVAALAMWLSLLSATGLVWMVEVVWTAVHGGQRESVADWERGRGRL